MSKATTLVLVWVAAACGGLSEGARRHEDRAEPTTGGAPSAGAMSGGRGGGGGRAAAAGRGGSSGGEPCKGVYEDCIEDCAVGGGDVSIQTVCEDGEWRCPSGSTRFSECPPGTCAARYNSCCDPTTGVGFAPTCDPGPYGEDCPAGSVMLARFATCFSAKGQACTADVAETRGTACPIESARCLYGDGCGATLCECRPGSSDELLWQCETNPC